MKGKYENENEEEEYKVDEGVGELTIRCEKCELNSNQWHAIETNTEECYDVTKNLVVEGNIIENWEIDLVTNPDMIENNNWQDKH